MMCIHGTVSGRPWTPIFNLRTRHPYVQAVVCDLLKQLKQLRMTYASLPTIPTIVLPPNRQLRVTFGDLNGLCDAIKYILNDCGILGVSYGGPDDRGTLWIKFYQMHGAGEDENWENRLQYVIWIDSIKPTITALYTSSKIICHVG